jgi:flagellar export protein FliJ
MPMKFEFSLEPVLKVRKHEEKIQKQKLAEKLSEKKELSEQKQFLQQKLKKHLMQTDREDYNNVHDLQRHRQYINEMHQKLDDLNGSLKVIENAISQQRDKLAEVHKKRHIIEKIKDEERELFLEKVSRKQRKVMDEVAMQTFSK